MEKIDTDYKQRNWKMKVKCFKSFNRDVAPLSWNVINFFVVKSWKKKCFKPKLYV